MNIDKVEKYRKPHPLGFPHSPGDPFGWFEIPASAVGHKLFVMAAPVDDVWQHLSVSLRHRCPTWSEMCKVKDLFWEPEEVVVQFHPPKSEWVNNSRFCLHLWSWRGGEMPRPPSILVGFN